MDSVPEELSRCLKVTIPFLNIRSKIDHDCATRYSQGKPSLSPAGLRRFFCQSLKGVNDGCRQGFCIIILNLTAPYFCHIKSWQLVKLFLVLFSHLCGTERQFTLLIHGIFIHSLKSNKFSLRRNERLTLKINPQCKCKQILLFHIDLLIRVIQMPQ